MDADWGVKGHADLHHWDLEPIPSPLLGMVGCALRRPLSATEPERPQTPPSWGRFLRSLCLTFVPHVGAPFGDELQCRICIHRLGDGMHAGHVLRVAPEDPDGNADGENAAAYEPKVPLHCVLPFQVEMHTRGQLRGEAPQSIRRRRHLERRAARDRQRLEERSPPFRIGQRKGGHTHGPRPLPRRRSCLA